ncbi:putative dehydrogenase [Sediminihabitans luteus]|uniref:Putative dehydrogenase n=1 Tax=Sediminihabitans luteus TaxID=1138585 RepID=A0A2M9CZR0_9CELL|nr:Gfo/Idh/MocA family oxidoreductase [Sediminihabitans luteus]PJJ77431.1 putative dehydrogenase [Sediminihabitans luteus]GII98324.1 oxidoreductase [Sediminihabitans luteus]
MRATIVGAGAIAHAHAHAIAAIDGAELTRVVDLDPDRARALADEFGAPHAGTDVSAALATGDVDVLHVCTPPTAHLEAALTALAVGVHVVLEKPPVLSLAQMDELVTAEAASSASLTVIVQHRFGSGAVRLRDLLDRGALGRPLVATCDTLWFRDPAYFAVPWRGRWETEGGGPTMGHGIHQFDLLLSLLGPWAEVRAVAARQDRDTETEDVSMALVTFENGAVASIVNSVLSPRETSQIRIDTQRATIELEHLYGYDDSAWTFTPAPGEDVAHLWTSDPDAPESGHLGQLEPTYAAFAAGQAPPVTSADARRTLDLAASIYRSAFTGETVHAGTIVAGDPFHASMAGDGAPWAAVAATTGASR